MTAAIPLPKVGLPELPSPDASPALFPQSIPQVGSKLEPLPIDITQLASKVSLHPLEVLANMAEPAAILKAQAHEPDQGLSLELLHEICEPFFDEMLQKVHKVLLKRGACLGSPSESSSTDDSHNQKQMSISASLKAIREYRQWGKSSTDIDSDASECMAFSSVALSSCNLAASLSEAESLRKLTENSETTAASTVMMCRQCKATYEGVLLTPRCSCGCAFGGSAEDVSAHASIGTESRTESCQLVWGGDGAKKDRSGSELWAKASHHVTGKRKKGGKRTQSGRKSPDDDNAAGRCMVKQTSVLQDIFSPIANMMGMSTPKPDPHWGWPAPDDTPEENPASTDI